MSRKRGQKIGYIYKTLDLINGLVYVGQRVCYWSIDQDQNYLGSGTIITKMINKYGKSRFTKSILEIVDPVDQLSLDKLEIYWIDKLRSYDHTIGYNIKKGGNAGGDAIKNNPNKQDILRRRSETWHKNFNNERRANRKKQLDEARKLVDPVKRGLKKRKKIVELDMAGNIVGTYGSIYDVNGLKLNLSLCRRNGIHRKSGRRFGLWIDGLSNYGTYKKVVVWNKGKKTGLKSSSTWKKGNIPWNKDLKGIHLSTKSQWQKGRKTWNKNTLKVTNVEYLEDVPDYVYNLKIKDNHNYYVNGILTHNCDDPQDPQMATSEVERENTKNFYDHTLYSRVNDPEVGMRIIVMQRLHEDDLTGHLMNPKTGRPGDHFHICIPGEYDEKIVSPPELKDKYVDGLFWVTRFNRVALAQYEKTLGSLQYAGQIGQRPAPKEGNLVKRDWFAIKTASEVSRDREREPVMFFGDTAYTEKQENDPSGLMACFKRDGVLYILNIAEVNMIFPDLIEFTKAYVNLNDYSRYGSMIWIEPKASGKSLVQSLRANSDLNIGEIESELVNGKDKMGRLTACSPYVQAGRVVLLEGTWNEHFLSQVCSFPNAAHDEFVDLLCYAIDELIIRGGGELIG